MAQDKSKEISIIIKAVDEFSAVLSSYAKQLSNSSAYTEKYKSEMEKLSQSTKSFGQNLREVAIDSLKGKINGASTATASFGQRLKEVANMKFTGLTQPVTELYSKLQLVSSAINQAAGAFNTWSDFEQRMAEVNTIVDTSKDSFNGLKEKVLELSREIPQSASQLAAGLYDLISSGASLEEAPKALELAAKAATAGVTDTKTAINVGMGVINAYGMSLNELGSVYDKLFVTVKDGVTTFPELASSIGQVMPVARSAGLSIDEVMASVAGLTKAGIKTSEAITALKGAITNLVAPSSGAKDAMAELGIEYTNFTDTLRQIKELNLGPEDIRKIIPDSEAATAVMSLTQNYDELVKILGHLQNAAGATKAANDKLKDTPENQVKLLKNALDDLAITIGAGMSPALMTLITGLSDVAKAVGELLSAFYKLGDNPVFKAAMYGSKLGFNLVTAPLDTLKDLGERLGLVSKNNEEVADSADKASKSLESQAEAAKKVNEAIEEAPKASSDDVAASADKAADSLEAQAESADKAAQETVKLNEEVDELVSKNGAETNISFSAPGLDEIKNLYDAIQDKTVTITQVVKTVEEHARGGLVGALRMAVGGMLGGYGGGDKIRAMLEAGEFVIRKEAVRKYGAGLFHALNSLRFPVPEMDFSGFFSMPEIPKIAYAAGGPVSGSSGYMVLDLKLGDTVIQTYTDSKNSSIIQALNKELSRKRKVGYQGV